MFELMIIKEFQVDTKCLFGMVFLMFGDDWVIFVRRFGLTSLVGANFTKYLTYFDAGLVCRMVVSMGVVLGDDQGRRG